MAGEVARDGGEAHGVARDGGIDVHALHRGLQCEQLRQLDHALHVDRLLERALRDRVLVLDRGIVDQHLEHEAVDLRLGQRIGALGLDRVLRRHDQERPLDDVRRAADRDLSAPA